MAKVTIVPEKIQTIIKVIEEQKVTLELSEKEAIVLRTILGRIGGCPYSSARMYADNVYVALSGIKSLNLGSKDSIYLSKFNLDLKEIA
jgi:hypothetical protein